MDPDAAVYDRFSVDRVADGPKTMTFALSNRCNLACSMCTPELSSTLRHRAGLPAIVNPYDDAFFADLARFLPNLEYAKFLGGEPFLIPEHYRVWGLMADVGGPPRIQVTTNGTIWNGRVEGVLDAFDVDVTVSIDGSTRETYESIRSGASFDLVTENIGRFASYTRSRGTELRLCFCLMDRNAHELAGMVRWADRLDAPVSVNVVSDVGFALHDRPLDDLVTVLEQWRSDEALGAFGRNAPVWSTQVRQLEAVLAERRAGLPRPARQAQPPRPGLLRLPSSSAGEPAGDAEAIELGRLSEWACGRPAAVLRGSREGTIEEIAATAPHLGLDDRLVGGDLDDVLPTLVGTDGRQVWSIGVDDDRDGVMVRTFALAAERPVRGVAGLLVRVVILRSPPGFSLLVADDPIYDRGRGEATAVPAPTRRV